MTIFDAGGSYEAAISHIEENFNLRHLTSVEVNTPKKTTTFHFAKEDCTIINGFSLGNTTAAKALLNLLVKAGFPILYAQDICHKNYISVHVHRGSTM